MQLHRIARVCMAIHEDPWKAHTLTIKRNTVNVLSDGSAVLGLGNIGRRHQSRGHFVAALFRDRTQING
ncbi:hypothetical protein ASG85_08520 [Paenibacillus sp. Soil724D2]|nr:hypothetical protein ASG85_08520 [Paenibacillus sp. Soil724D2]